MSGSIVILFLFALTLHNIEEGIWFSRQQHSNKISMKMHRAVSQDEFLFGLIWVTGLAYVITALYIFYPDIYLFKYTYFGFVTIMIVNVVFPHLVSTIIDRCYSPGLFTGIIAIIPINLLIIGRGIQLGMITLFPLLVSTLVLGAILIFTIPLSFIVGKRIIIF